jgi:FkbM family methyltransferase
MEMNDAGAGLRDELIARLDRIVTRARLTRWEKLRRHPLSALYNSASIRLLYFLARWCRSFQRQAVTFFDERMTVLLPSGYGDVYTYGATMDSDAEVRLNKLLIRELKDGMTFFDVGACLGYYSLLASRLVGASGGVHVFEPSPPLLPVLRRNLDGKSNVRLVEQALDETPGQLTFYVAPFPFIGTSSLRSDWQKRTEPVTVKTVRLDDYCWAAGAFPDVLKIDAEGTEDRILRGAKRLLGEKPPLIAMEVFLPLLDSDRRALRVLEDLGYIPYAIRDDGGLRALGYGADLDAYLAGLKPRYLKVQQSVNDFDNLVFRRPS